jgi:hypothetical protein
MMGCLLRSRVGPGRYLSSHCAPARKIFKSMIYTPNQAQSTSYDQLLPPYYSSSLNAGERRLQMASSSSRNLSGTYTHSDKGFTVLLYHQQQNAKSPTFDGLEPVTGLLILSDSGQSTHDTVSAQVCTLNLARRMMKLTSSSTAPR